MSLEKGWSPRGRRGKGGSEQAQVLGTCADEGDVEVGVNPGRGGGHCPSSKTTEMTKAMWWLRHNPQASALTAQDLWTYRNHFLISFSFSLLPRAIRQCEYNSLEQTD